MEDGGRHRPCRRVVPAPAPRYREPNTGTPLPAAQGGFCRTPTISAASARTRPCTSRRTRSRAARSAMSAWPRTTRVDPGTGEPGGIMTAVDPDQHLDAAEPAAIYRCSVRPNDESSVAGDPVSATVCSVRASRWLTHTTANAARSDTRQRLPPGPTWAGAVAVSGDQAHWSVRAPRTVFVPSSGAGSFPAQLRSPLTTLPSMAM